MKIVGLSGSKVGSKTRTAMDYTMTMLRERYPNSDTVVIDLAEYEVEFSDGRNYLEF